MNRQYIRPVVSGSPFRLAVVAVFALLLFEAVSPALAGKKIAHIPGSRFGYVHRLGLMCPEGKPLKLDQTPVMPFSYRNTCNKCHKYDVIKQGWHFNATDPNAMPGRPGEPWFWTDQTTGTQIPFSYRNWPNCMKPGDIGLKPWAFLLMFGSHTPGGGPGEMTTIEDPKARWLVSGKSEINCGSCHSGDPKYDQVENFLQIARQNFMWAPAASNSFVSVSGAAAAMPAFYDPFMGPEDEKMAKKAPTVTYDRTRVDAKGRVTFNLPSESPSKRCYFCHSATQVGPGAPDSWKTDEDVHMLAGLSCTDCHRNGLKHKMTRNYEGEKIAEGDGDLQTLTCRGCHMGTESAKCGPNTLGGRLGAPVPKHIGLPKVHLDKLTCTMCHSGLYPGAQTGRVQTSRAHKLEFQGSHRGPNALPYIVEPVFALRPYDGKIGPQRMVWPAFWARIDGDNLKAMSPTEVYTKAKDAFKDDKAESADEDTKEKPADDKAHEGATATKPDLPPERVKAILKALAEKEEGTKFGYVCSERLHTLDSGGNLTAEEHPACQPVSWPIAHNVRPAGRSLGTRGCIECHGFSAPVAFGNVEIASPADLGDPGTKPMYALQDRNPGELKAWAMSFMFRPFFKIVGFTTAGIIALILLAYATLGLAGLTRWFSRLSAGSSSNTE